MVEIPMFSLCDVKALKLALTACLSGPQLASLRGKKRKKREASSMRVSVSVRAWIWKKLAHRRKISDFLWWEHAVKKKKGARQNNSCTHAYQRESIRDTFTSLDAAYFYWTHFLQEIAFYRFCTLQLNQSEKGTTKKKKHTADYCQVCALIFLWSQTPQSNYKISLINTALDHKHDTEDPSIHSPFLK